MKQRSPGIVIVLTIVTLGIYSLFWLRDTKNDMRRFGQTQVPSMWWLVTPVLVLLAGYAVLVGGYMASGATNESSNSVAMPVISIIAVLVLIPAYLLATFYPLFWYYRYCQAVEKVTGGALQLNTSYVLYILGWLLGIPYFIFQYKVQNTFNKISQKTTGPTHSSSTSESVKTTTKTSQHSGPVSRKA